MLAHGAWAQVLMLGGATELALVRGKLQNQWWRLGMAAAFVVSGIAFLVHEQNAWLFQRSAFLHSSARVDAARQCDLPAGSLRAPAFPGRGDRFRADLRCRLGDALTAIATSPRSRAQSPSLRGHRVDEAAAP